MAITVDTIQLKFNVTPSYQQQQIQQLNADLKQATANYEALGKAAKDNAKEHSRLYGELSKMKTKRDELAKQKTLTEKQQQDLAAYNKKIEDLTDSLVKNEEQRDQLTKTESLARKEMVELQNQMNGVTQSTQRYNMTIQQLGEREKELRTLLNNIDPSTAEWEKYNRELSETKKRIADLRRQAPDFHDDLKLEEMTIKQLNERIGALRTALNDCKPNTPEFKEYSDALKETESQLKKVEEEIGNTKISFSKFVDGFNKIAWATQFVYQGFQKVVQWADKYVQAFAKMDDAMTDVMKYTGQTKAEVEDMNEAFKQMTTRTAREELNALAGAAGRLGIQGKENIIGFVDAADKINVALGDDLGEGAIDQIGKLTMVFGEDKTKGLNGAMLATGSAINVLGANSSANTGFITEFTSDMAGMAVNAKIAQTDIMGYASALSQAGVEGKTASGVFAQLITKMFTDPAKFAKAAKLDVKAFTDLLKTDANAAILQFLEGLKQNGGFDALAPALKSLKMQGTQAVPVISSLINKMDELKKAQKDAREAYDEGTSIIEEFNNANSSAAAKLEIAKKAMNDVAAELGQKLMPIVENSIRLGTLGIKAILQIISLFTRYTPVIVALTTAIVALTVAEYGHIAAEKLMELWTGKVKVAMVGLFNVLKAHPLILLTSAVTGLALALNEWYNSSKKVISIQERLNKVNKKSLEDADNEKRRLETLVNIARSKASSDHQRKGAIEELNRIAPDYLGFLNAENINTQKADQAIKDYTKSILLNVKAKNLAAKIDEVREQKKNAKDNLDNGEYSNWYDPLGAGVNSLLNTISKTGNAFESFIQRGSFSGWDAPTALEEAGYAFDTAHMALNGYNNDLKNLENEEAAYNKELENTIKQLSELNGKKDNNEIVIPTNDGGSDSLTEKEKSEREKQRKEEEAQAKAAWEREKIELRQQYQGRKDLQDEWHQKELTAEQAYVVKLLGIRNKYNAAESEMMEAQNMLLDVWAKEANYREEQRKRNQQESLHNIDLLQAEEEMTLLRQQLDGETKTQEEFNQKKLESEIKYQKMRLQYLQQGSAEYLAAQKQLLSLELQQQQQLKKEQEGFNNSYQNTNNQILNNHFSQAGSFEEMLRLNDEYRNKNLISEQQYQQNLTAITQEQNEARRQIEQATIDTVNQAMQATSQMFQMMQQRETAAVDAKYKKLIAAAKKQGKDTTKLEEQQEAEKQAIKKKYADKQFQLQILQIVAATAMSIANVWREWAWMPAVAAALTAAAAAQGAIQLATAKMAAEQASGLYKGGYSDEYQEGYTAKGNPKDQAGVIPVHKNEFVANHQAVANPQVRPLLDVIDRHQKIGDIRMLDATRMLEEAYGRGRYHGGYTSGSEIDQNKEAGTDTQSGTKEIIELLRSIEVNTADAMTVREVRDAIRRLERLEKNASR